MNHRMRPFASFRAVVAGLVGAVLCLMLVGTTVAGAAPRSAAKPKPPAVLYVGTFDGITTPADATFTTIQAAVNAATKNAWILIAPGDYHETDDVANPPSASDLASGWYGGVDVETQGLHLRGLDRNSVIVDGTLSTAATPCSSAPSDQNFLGGDGRNGILVWKTKGVSVDNLTVCNFLNGSGNAGNEIWWNGGQGSGAIGLKDYSGQYLTATSTYFANSDPSDLNICSTCALYGIFASNSKGGSWNQIYASNFADSGMYIGACHRICDATVDNAWMEYNALGYSGTNSGGPLVIENSMFDKNKEGVDTNTALTGDPPPPQDGRCTGGVTPVYSVTDSCWVFEDNVVADNNNPNVPVLGTAGLGPTGTGMTLSGGRYDTVQDNEFVDNGAYGIVFAPYPDANTTSDGKTCAKTGGLVVTSLGISGVSCLYDPEGDALLNNEFYGNGTDGNAGNADYGNLLAGGYEPENCFSGNNDYTDGTFTTVSGPASDANVIDGYSTQTSATCGVKTAKTTVLGANTDLNLLLQLECDAGVLTGPGYCGSASYPQATSVTMQALPSLPSMPNPCLGVPTNVWCPSGVLAAKPK